MKHSDIRNLMADYLEGDLDLDKRALFDAHIDECAECASEINEMRATISLLHMLPQPRVPAGMSQEVMRRIESGETQSIWTEKLKAVFGPLLEPRVLAPISAAVLVLGLVLGTDNFRSQSAETQSYVGSTATVTSPGSVLRLRPVVDAASQPPFMSVQRDTATSPSQMIRLTPRQEMIALSKLLASTSPLGQIRFQVWPEPPLAAGPGYLNSQPPSEFQTVSASPEGPRPLGVGRSRATSSGLKRSRQPSTDEWLLRLEADPGSFAGRLATASLAEQELWVEHLAKRAVEQERLNEVVASLRSSPSRRARLLADDFEAAGRRGGAR